VPRTARTLTGVLAWLGAVVVATVVGLMAVNAIGTGLVGPGQQVLDPAEVDARLAAAGPAPPVQTTAAPPSSSAPTPDATPTVIPSAGGTVVARCVDGGVEIVSASPAQGWDIHDEADEDRSRVRFENGNDRVELRLSCVAGKPQAQIRTD
jgi:hypothetical protein